MYAQSNDSFNQRLNSRSFTKSFWGTATYSFINRPFTGSNLVEFGNSARNSLVLISPNLRKMVSPKTPVNIFPSIKKAGLPNIIRFTELRSVVRTSRSAVFSGDGLGQGKFIRISKFTSLLKVLRSVN